MIGLRLTEFITRLRNSTTIEEYDRTFLSNFDKEFELINPAVNLSAAQLKWLDRAFNARWKAIIDSVDHHYTLDQGDTNGCWIKLARDIASSLDKTYLQILMPTVTNTLEANTFVKIVDCELRDLYLGEGGKTLYTISGILKNFQKGLFYTYELNPEGGKYIQRPLSLSEWRQIRLKSKVLSFEVSGIAYESAWDYITQVVIPHWSESKEFPRHQLSPLLGLVQFFYAGKGQVDAGKNLSDKLLLWSNFLQEYSIDEVNCLYGEKIQVGNKKVYLIDILIDCLHTDEPSSNDKMLALARWLHQYDASLIVNGSQEMKDLYIELHAASAFNIIDLQSFLSQMLDTSSSLVVTRAIVALQVDLLGKTTIDAEIMAALIEIYRLRWIQVIDKREDYLRLQGGVNEPWIRLAQSLKGAGHLKRSYYWLLMPTVAHDEDPVRRALITDYPLSHYILSTDQRSLIFLGNCEKFYIVNGTFNRCDVTPVCSLSEVEIARMQYAHPKYHRYIKYARGLRETDQSVSKNTVLAVFDLVNNSLYPNGLLFAHDYDPIQMEAAGRAYHCFYNFLHRLPKAERERLFAQKISWQGKNVSFKSVLEDVQADKCIAICGQFFAKMVMDYAPYLRFRPEIEARARVGEMRTHSLLKVFSNYSKIDDNEAKRRIQILAASLMSYGFQYMLTGENLPIWDCSNTIGHVSKDIYRLIAPMVKSGNYKNARYVYVKIIEAMVIPALRNKDVSWLTWLTRPTATQFWLESIVNQSMFTSKSSWYRPELLLATLLPIPSLDPKTQLLLEAFIEELVHTYAQPQNKALKEIRVNVKFMQLLQSLEDTPRRQILRVIESSRREVDAKGFYGIYANFIIRRLLSCLPHGAGKSQEGFFIRVSGRTDVAAASRRSEIREILTETVTLEDNSPQSIIDKLFVKINRISSRVCGNSEKSKMKEYLERLRSPIASTVTFVGTEAARLA